MIFEQDMSQVPDQRLKIPAGIYECLITEEGTKPPKDPKTQGTNIVLGLKIVNHPDQADRELSYYVFIPADLKRADALTPIKRVFLSAGIPPGAKMDTRMLVGKVIKVRVDNGTYKDERSGQLKESYGIGEVFIPSDNVSAGSFSSPQQTQPSAAAVANILGTPTPTPTPSPAPQVIPPIVAPAPQPVAGSPIG